MGAFNALGNATIPFACATKCGTSDMCATSATNLAQNVAQFCIDVQFRQDEEGRKNEKALV